MQRLGKHVPAATDMHVTIEVLLETAFPTRSVKGAISRTTTARRGSWNGVTVQKGLKQGRREIVIVRNRYQEKSSEDIAGWRRLSVCCSDFLSVEISDSYGYL
jgi:hypothetical protein